MPKRGRGEYRKIAETLRMHPTLVSQVFKGNKDLTREQALDLSNYLGLGELETDYLVTLVDFARSGTSELKGRMKKHIEKLRVQSLKLSARLPTETQLTEEARAIFYSNWYYSGVRLLTSIQAYQSVDRIAEYFGISKSKTGKILDFLLRNGLCVLDEGNIKMGPRQTHLEAESPLVQRHHTNWRLKAMQRYENLTESELCYSGPMSIAEKDFFKIREMISQLIQDATKIATTSREETLVCLNVDWFKV